MEASEVTIVEGLPVTTVERTIADLLHSRNHGDPEHIARIVGDALIAARLDVDRLADLLEPLAARYKQPSGEAVVDISCKPGDRFDEDEVDFALSAVGQHPLEFLPLIRPGSGDALIGVNIRQLPFLIFGDEVLVVIHLYRKGVQLIGGVAADSGIGADTQLGRGILKNGVYRFNNLYLRHGGTSFGFCVFMCGGSFRVSSIPFQY